MPEISIDLSKSREFYDPSNFRERIHIIGCGAIGSTLAENLARFGFKKFVLYDFDKVEPHNIANQMFTQNDLGKLKVDCVKQMITAINPSADVKTVETGWQGERLAGYVFLAVDSIELRKKIATENRLNPHVKAMFDFRMGLTDAQHFAADWKEKALVDGFIDSMDFTDEEARAATPVSACNIVLSVCPTVRMIVAMGVANFINFLKGKRLKKTAFVYAFDFEIDAYE